MCFQNFLNNQTNIFIFTVILMLGSSGCARSPSQKAAQDETHSALKGVAGGLSGQDLVDVDLNEINKQIASDKEAQSAIETVSDAFDDSKIQVKYCPLTGKRYSAHLNECPIHNVELKVVE